MQGGVGVAKPLGEFESLAEERIIDAKHLRQSARPTDALPDVCGKAFGGKPRRLRQFEIGGGISAAVHP